MQGSFRKDRVSLRTELLEGSSVLLAASDAWNCMEFQSRLVRYTRSTQDDFSDGAIRDVYGEEEGGQPGKSLELGQM